MIGKTECGVAADSITVIIGLTDGDGTKRAYVTAKEAREFALSVLRSADDADRALDAELSALLSKSADLRAVFTDDVEAA